MRKKLLLIKIVLALASLGIVASLFAQDTVTVTATTEQTFLGVGLAESNNQVVISRVMNASPADQAGLLIGDVITSVNGTAVTTATEVSDLVLALAAGDVVTLEIERQGEAQTVEATLVSLPVSAMGGRHGNHGGFGGRGGDMNDDMDDMFGWHFGNGMPFAEGEIFAMPIPADQTMAEMLLGADLTETDAGQEVVSIWDNHLGLELQVGDIITSVNGVHVVSVPQMREVLQKNGVDKPASFVGTRAGKSFTTTVTPVLSEKTADGKQVVVIKVLGSSTYHFPFDVKIRLDDVGGPSAGLMFSLGVLDTITPENMTGGRKIAGTGTIDASGLVGPIGGIRQKMFSAVNASADYMFVPADNCSEAFGHVPTGLKIFKVSTLDDAVAALKVIAKPDSDGGRTAELAKLPTCTKKLLRLAVAEPP